MFPQYFRSHFEFPIALTHPRIALLPLQLFEGAAYRLDFHAVNGAGLATAAVTDAIDLTRKSLPPFPATLTLLARPPGHQYLRCKARTL